MWVAAFRIHVFTMTSLQARGQMREDEAETEDEFWPQDQRVL